jgi:hypothetical protein
MRGIHRRNHHDARYIDILVVLVLIVFVVASFEFTTRIQIASPKIGIPAQTVRW